MSKNELTILEGEDETKLGGHDAPRPSPPKPSVKATAKQLLAQLAPSPSPRVRDYSDVDLLKITVGPPRRETYHYKTVDFQVVKTYTYELTSRAKYRSVNEEMCVSGGGLRRALHDFFWARSALVQEFPGVIVPPITTDACKDESILETWFERCLRHPAIRKSAVLKCFALSPPSEFSTQQRDFSTDLGLAPLNVQLTVLFLKSKDAVAALQDKRGAADETRDDDDASERERERRGREDDDDDDEGVVSAKTLAASATWVREETGKLERCLVAVTAAAKADEKLAKASNAASRTLTMTLTGSGSVADKYFPTDFETAAVAEHRTDGDDSPMSSLPQHEDSDGFLKTERSVFGPAMAAPLLRDALGYLQAAGEAVAGLADARRTVRAAKDNVRKHEASKRQGEDWRERAKNSSPKATTETGDAATKAKALVAVLSHKATQALQKTAAHFASGENDVESAKNLLYTLEKKFKAASDALDAELPALRDFWPNRLRAVFDTYTAGEKRRAAVAKDLATVLLVQCGGFSPPSVGGGPSADAAFQAADLQFNA